MGRAEGGVSADEQQRFELWLAAFKALRIEDENAWRMFPNDDRHNVFVATTFINIVRLNDDDAVRRSFNSFPNFTTEALVRLAHRLRVQVVKMRLD